MSASSQKGSRRERQLIADLREAGLFALRCPASGAASTADLPDILAMREFLPVGLKSVELPVAKAHMIEAKASKSGTVHLAHDEIEALCRCALVAGATPIVAVRPDYSDWSFFQPVELNQNDKSRSVTQDMLPGPTFEEVFVDG